MWITRMWIADSSLVESSLPATLLANATGQWMFLIGLALIVSILLRRYYKYYRRLKRGNRKRKVLARSEGIPGQALADAPVEVLRWQVEMHETARDLKAELDSKMRVLQTLVRQADDRVTHLTQLIERARSTKESSAAVQTRGASPIDQAGTESGAALKTTLGEEGEDTPSPHGGYGLPGTEGLRRSIYQLADRGWEARRISGELDCPLADVELVLAVRSANVL